ncbi:MAG: hypothetical protein H7Y11_10780 [Armatimonadetes bacterium]|nr:hypothetical protein [Anaerolineae bacterium]
MMANRLAVGASAPEGILSDVHNEEAHLSTFWAKGPTLLTFLRHFG